ncbi:MAG: alpha/beta fold hydrolase [Desulfosoma sp.]
MDSRVKQPGFVFKECVPSKRGCVPAVVHSPTRSAAFGHGSPGVVICCHGLLSAKDSPKFVQMGERLAEEGLWVLRFDFTGCGENTCSFKRSLLETRLDDLQSVVDWVCGPNRPWGDRPVVGLFGSSLGGFLSYVFSGRFPERIKATAVWAAPARLHDIGAGSNRRPLELEPAWPSKLPLGTPNSIDALPSVSNVLVLHGTKDELVPWHHATVLYRAASEEKRLILLEDADHRLTDAQVRAKATELTASWLFSKLMER